MDEPTAPDPLEAALRAAPLNDRQRAGLWDMYEASRNADDLAARMQSIDIPQEVKAQLWDLKSQEGDKPKAATWSDRLGLNEPTDSMIHGFHRGVGSAAVDMVQGVASSLLGTANAFAGVEDRGAATAAGVAGKPHQPTPLAEMSVPDTAAGKIGTILPDIATMAVPVGGAVKAGVNAIPRASRAGAKFQEVMGAARNIPVETQGIGDAALRINQLAERGGSMPMSVRKLLNRLTDPNKAAMTYEESRDFASNIGRLSADEMKRLQPVVRREVANLAAKINEANAKAAQQAGKMAEYKSAMREYRQAMQLRDAMDTVIKRSKQAAIGAAGLGGAAYIFGRD